MLKYMTMRWFNCVFSVTLFLILGVSLAAQDIDVVYPRPGQRISAVDSTFIFGNVTPGSQLQINGSGVQVYKNGAFLAFLAITPGEFVFTLRAELNGDTTIVEIPIEVPIPYKVPGIDSLVILTRFMSPARDMGLMAGDRLNVSFRGTPGCHAYFTISTDGQLNPMTETPPAIQSYWGEALFGAGDVPDSLLVRGVYTGVITLQEKHISDSSTIRYYLCRQALSTFDSSDPAFVGDSSLCECITQSNKINLSVMDKDEIIIGELIDSTQTIRTGPRKGYLSIFQPKGLRFRITGRYGNYLRALLAPGQPTWMPDSSIRILPQGTQPPHGEVVLVRTRKIDQGVVISFDPGAQAPFRVEEDVVNNRIVLDIYNCISNIDWIRYDNDDHLVNSIRWSQPQEEVMRLVIDLHEPVWGYDCYYTGSIFNLKLKSAPNLKWGLRDLRIVIDPGHCPDPGAIGPTRLTEKDANLAIALELADILKKKKAKVMLTRKTDTPLPIYDRPKIAYKYDADIFVSIHNNALPDGVNPFVNNGSSCYYYHPHSKSLADAVQKRLIDKIGYNDFGTYHANFAVTRPTGYVGILVECAFMMIPEQEMALKEKSFQKKLAGAIADGICDFVKEAKKKRTNLSRHRR